MTLDKEWDYLYLEDVCEKIMVGIASAATHAYRNEGIVLLRNQNIKENKIDTSDILHIDPEYEIKHRRKRLRVGDILTVRTGYPGLSAVVPIQFDGAQCFTSLISRPNNEIIDSHFLCYYINSDSGKRFINSGEAGGAQKNVNVSVLSRMKVPVPSLDKQRKIVKILGTWDEALTQTERLIALEEQRKKGLMQRLLTGQVRFPEFEQLQSDPQSKQVSTQFQKRFLTNRFKNLPANWKFEKLSNLLQERVETSSDTEKYPLHSLTIESGVTPKSEQYERSYLLKDKDNNQYKLVYPGDLVFNPMNLRFGAIAFSKASQIVTVSAYYNVLAPLTSKCDIGFMNDLLSSYPMINMYDVVAIGSLLEKRRVHLSIFNDLVIPLPPLEEQRKIAAVLQTCDEKITLLQQKLAALQQQKKGLMQRLLTGQLRVKV